MDYISVLLTVPNKGGSFVKDYINIKEFFDSLDQVGVYVLDRITRKLLYYNKAFKAFFPSYSENCQFYHSPETSSDTSENTTCNRNSDFKYKIDIQKGQWNDCDALIVSLQTTNDESLKIMKKRLKTNEEIINLMSDTLNVGLKTSLYDEMGTILYINESLVKFLGYSHKEFMELCGGIMGKAIYPPDLANAQSQVKDCLDCSDEYHCEYRIRTKTGELKWVLESGKKIVDDDGTVKLYSALSDITDIKNSMNELEYQANYDNLTGIYNRNTFYKQTKRLITENPDKVYAIMRWDIARFKIFNDLFTHEEGDRLLRYISRTLKNIIGTAGTYARFDSDIFVMCVEAQKGNLDKVMDSIIDKLNEYPVNFDILPRFGIYMIDNINMPINIMCDRANLAHKTVKGSFLKKYAIYNDNLRTSLVKEHEITSEMSIALEQEQFEVYLQPKYDLTYENIIGAEALVRWIHPEKGFISPGAFIPIFERNGFIMKLDEYIWERTCKILRRWIDEGKRVVPISVNISRIDLYNPHLSEFLIGLIRKYDLDPKLLELEITESAYTENSDQLMPVMRKLQEYGFIILMDDFGTGYSSLNMLKDVPVNVLKIDMNFLTEDIERGRGGVILSSIVRMAKWLSLPVVAEGVETNTQVDFLRSIGCNLAQGYYYSRPVPVAEFEKLMEYSRSPEDLNKRNLLTDIDLGDLWNPNSKDNVLFDNLLSAVAMYELSNTSLEIVRANDEYFRITGTDCIALNGGERNIFSQIHPDDVDFLKELITSATESVPTTGEFRRYKNNGDLIWLRAQFRLLASSSNNERAIIYSSMIDITDRKQKELSVESENTHMKNAFDNTPVAMGIFEVKNKMRTVFINSNMLAMLGYTSEEYASRAEANLLAIMPEADAESLYGLIVNTKKLDKPVEITLEFIRADKTHTKLGISINMSTESDGRKLCYITAQTAQACSVADCMVNETAEFIGSTISLITFDYDAVNDILSFASHKNGNETKYTVKAFTDSFMQMPLLHTDSIAPFMNWIFAKCSGETDTTVDIMANFSAEAYTWFNADGKSICDENGKVIRIIGYLKDIQLEKTLSLEKDDTLGLFSTIIDLAPGGVFKAAVDGHFTILYANDGFYKSHGYTKEEFESQLDNKAMNWVHPDDVEPVRVKLLDVLSKKEDFFQTEVRVVLPNGNIEYDMVRHRIVYHKDGPVIYGVALNITNEKRLERRLEKQKKHNQAITSDLLWYYDIDLNDDFIKSSYSGTDEFTLPTDFTSFSELVKSASANIHPDFKDSVKNITDCRSLINEFNNGNEQVVFKYTTLNSAREYSDVTTVFNMQQNPFTGHVECFLCSYGDSSASQERAARDKSFHNVIASDVIVSYKVNFTQGTAEKYKGDDAINDTTFSYDTFVNRMVARVSEDSQKHFVTELLNLENIDKKFESSTLSNSIEYTRFDKFGNPIWVQTTLILSIDEKTGDKIGYINIRNINDYKINQEQRNDSLKRYGVQFKNSYDVIYEVNFTENEITILDFDDTGVVKKPHPAGDLAHAIPDFLARFHPESDIEDCKKILSFEYIDGVFSSGTDEFQRTLQVLDAATNKYRWTSYWFRKLTWNDRQQKIGLLYAKNVHAEREEQEQSQHMLKSALAMAEHANKAKSEFLSKMSHDVRTPMNAIIGMTTIARDNIDNKEKVLSCIDSINDSSNYLLMLINNVLDMSKIETGQTVIKKSEFSINDMVATLREMFDVYQMNKKIDFKINVADNVSDTLIGDKLYINQIIVNLVTNAFQYSNKEGKVTLDISTVEKTGCSEVVKFVISDNGIGIDKAHLNKIFEPFEQIDNNLESGGSGLGLAIVHSLVHIMDGVIEVDSEPGKGSKFTVTLPLGRVKDKKSSKSDNSDKSYDFDGQTILLVEDNELNREIAQALLEFVNLKVEVAENGRIAFEKFTESPTDYYKAILMDIRMPVMDGREATKQIRQLPRTDAKNIPIIAMSADAFSEDIKFSQRIGMDDYITKPIDRNQLYKSLNKFINN